MFETVSQGSINSEKLNRFASLQGMFGSPPFLFLSLRNNLYLLKDEEGFVYWSPILVSKLNKYQFC